MCSVPIYAYKCSACGYAKDVLQKLSDAPLSVCPSCGVEAFSKQVTAAGFQLKGAGWYVTDFRAGGDGANSGVGKDATSTAPAADKAAAAPTAGSAAAPVAAPPPPPSTPAPAPAPAKPAAAAP